MPVRLQVKSRTSVDAAPQELVHNEDVITIGRDKGCLVVLEDASVSRNHLRITHDGALYFAEDLGSSAGTRVNGSTLPKGEKRLLRNGDVIAIGPYDVVFDRMAEQNEGADKTSFMARKVVRDALRGGKDATPYLRVMNGPMEGMRVEIQPAQEVIIGREDDCDIKLDNDDLVSRRHAKVRRDWSGVTVEDLGSRNGLKVNQKKATQQALQDRDEIAIGKTKFLFLDPTSVREVALEPPSIQVAIPEDEPPPEEKHEEPESGEGAAGVEVSSSVKELPDEAPAEEPPPVNSKVDELPPVDSKVDALPNLDDGPPEDFAPPPQGAAEKLKGQLASLKDGAWKAYVPILIVAGVALAALAVLLVAIFAI